MTCSNYLFFIFAIIVATALRTTSAEPISCETFREYPEALNIYKCFLDRIFETLSDLGENNTQRSTADLELEGGSVASLVGISYMLAAIKQQGWSVSYPLFGTDPFVPNSSGGGPADILAALDQVSEYLNQTYTSTSVIFIPTTTNSNRPPNRPLAAAAVAGWKKGGKNLVEVNAVDFEEDDTTVPLINERIVNLTGGSVQQSYIEDGVLIPTSTLAVIVNVVKADLSWPFQWESAGMMEFNEREFGDSIQIRGNFKCASGDGETEVFLFFEGGRGGLALRMPKDIRVDRSVANLEMVHTLNTSLATVQLPLLNYIIRSNYELSTDESLICARHDFPKMLQLLDVLTSVRLDARSFALSSISGGQVVNTEEFRDEIRRLKNGTTTFVEGSKAADSREDVQDEAKVEPPVLTRSEEVIDEGTGSETLDYQTGGRAESVEVGGDDEGSEGNEREEDNYFEVQGKLLRFNRPFTWLFFDSYHVPIVGGVVVSLNPPEQAPPPAFSFLGMEEGHSSLYLNDCD